MPISDLSAVAQPVQPGGDEDGFALDVRLVEFSPRNTALMADTDDGCDTKKTGDC
jgi:FxLD family lantipeptide